MEEKYTIIGIHGADVPTVVGDVVRVRIFTANGNDSDAEGRTFTDEDFPLPVLYRGQQPDMQTYAEHLDSQILARIDELEAPKKREPVNE